MGDYQGGEVQLSPLGEPWVHTPGEVKKLINKYNFNAVQVVKEARHEQEVNGITIRRATGFLKELYM